MNELGTYEINEKELNVIIQKLKKDTIELSSNSNGLKQILNQNSNETLLKQCIQVIDDSLTPVLNKYQEKMEQISIEMNQVKEKEI